MISRPGLINHFKSIVKHGFLSQGFNELVQATRRIPSNLSALK
ncbi:hypothetical protein BFV94_4685 [Alteromonas macleodii]|uniref:Transposase n=1 Tax=Alteromonas macleodii TaxID=28108 RepID=A0AB36FQ97_ALTMA|nr:hypothetical protein BFV95_4913 [Alteromonas macleodii]OES24534.1 hypothetical protein BFV94_4685 [Alteromonas macleodii]OES25185.1 hypothetical protein BFV93_4516 [Alteromonas macleodii]OES38508.1 hypothetical protein BFV96_4919 [Alteromonas macleodii]